MKPQGRVPLLISILSRGGLTTQIHEVVDISGLTIHLALTTGEAHDDRFLVTVLSALKSEQCCSLNRGFSPHLCRVRNLVERFFNKVKQCRRVVTRYEKLAANYLAFSSLRPSGYGCASTDLLRVRQTAVSQADMPSKAGHPVLAAPWN
jgi:hypothetical protein